MASSPKTSNHLTGISILTIAFLSLCCPLQVLAADSFDDQGAKKISKLEGKFFQHSYPKDEPEVRLERLEKLIFGAPKTGTASDRLNALVTAVPILETKSEDDSTKAAAGTETKTGHKASGSDSLNKSGNRDTTAASEGSSEYPAVTAMEHKALGKDYVEEPIGQRLARLETKEFGRPSTSTDLSERVDRLKQRIGIDVARLAPAGSDWADDDEEDGMPMPIPSNSEPVAKAGEDGKSFSGRDIRSDMRKAFGGMSGTRSYSGPSGAYGMGSYGGGGSGGSGAYGFGGSGSSGMSGLGNSSSVGLMDRGDEDIPSVAPTRSKKRIVSSDPTVAKMDLPSQVSALEKEIFGKTHASDPLLTRLNRLETAVFPQQKPKVDEPLPERVKQLLAVVPVSEKRAGGKSKHSDDDLDDSDLALLKGSNSQAQQPHGLSKIINSLSNMMGGSNVGGYPMQSQSYITDPQTGMLIDQYTGNMIDPNTGVVVGTRTPIYGGTYGSGLGNYGGFGSFNNGFAPFGSPYGSPYGNPYGYGMGSGVHFGFGGGRLGGFWP